MQKIILYKDRAELPKGILIVDAYESALRELLIVRTPALREAPVEKINESFPQFIKKAGVISDVYAYYPWQKTAVRIPEEKIYFELRTARNRNIITAEEQEKYRNAKIGIIGLSVGFNVVSSLVLSGGPKFLKIADYDMIEITNLNRMRAPLYRLRTNKAEFAAAQIWELDPFADLEVWDKGVNKENLERFIARPRLDIFIDEMDSLELKFLARLLCRKFGIPVLMATDNGDNVILDVERFDEEPGRDIFHGSVKDINSENLANISYSEWVKIAVRIVDQNNLTVRMQESIKEIGKTVAAVPQLGTTATIAGSILSYAVRKIAQGAAMPSGRYVIDIDNLLTRPHEFS